MTNTHISFIHSFIHHMTKWEKAKTKNSIKNTRIHVTNVDWMNEWLSEEIFIKLRKFDFFFRFWQFSYGTHTIALKAVIFFFDSSSSSSIGRLQRKFNSTFYIFSFLVQLFFSISVFRLDWKSISLLLNLRA